MVRHRSTKRGDGAAVSRPRTCVLVLGMHRSGTSALTRILSLAGAKLPVSLMSPSPSNATGFWELVALVLHDRLLAELGSAWRDWRVLEIERLPAERLDHFKSEIVRVIEAEYGDAPLFVVKDPRICRFAGLFMDALDRVGIDVRPVIPIRNPLEVSDLLGRKYGNVSSIGGSLLWLHYVLNAEVSTRQRSRAVVSFDSVLQDWKDCLERITEQTGLSWPNSIEDISDEVSRFLDPTHRHHAHKAEDILSDPIFKPWIGGAYTLLQQLERRPDDPETLTTLDSIRTEFNHCGAMLHEVLRRVDDEVDRTKKLVVDLNTKEASNQRQRDAQLAMLKEALAAAESRADGLLANLTQRDTQSKTLRAALIKSENRVTELTSEVGRRDLHVKELEAAAVAAAAMTNDLSERLSRLDEVANQRAGQIVTAQARANDLAKTLLLRNALIRKIKDDVVTLESRAQKLAQDLADRATQNERLSVQITTLEKEARKTSGKPVLDQVDVSGIGEKRRRSKSTLAVDGSVSPLSWSVQKRGRKARAPRRIG